jgi:3-oxoacyl-[acyl-carrier protein] reductase
VDVPVTLITGTRTGIGRYLAEHYVRSGHRVVGCSRSPVDWHLEGYSHYVLDVADEPAVAQLLSEIRRQYQRLDHLINNAGAAAMNHSLLTPLASARRLVETNLLGTFLFCREAAKLMQHRRSGRIVNVTTVAVPLKLAGEALYVASKAAVLSLTQVLARELAPFGITVNAVGPGPIETELLRNVPRDKLDRVLALQAIPRLGTFRDVANVVDFFLKPESDFVTGQCVYLGGV